MRANKLRVDWDEAQATRDDRLTSTAWNASYGAIDGTDATAQQESAVLFQEGETSTWKSWNLTNVTQEWVDGDSSNYGVILWATNEDTDGYDLRFRRSEDASNQPKLEVTYTTDPLKTVFFLKDHLGSIRATVEEDGDVVGYTDYDPWGYLLANRVLETAWSGGQNVAQNKFTGKEWDDDYGLNWFYLGARPYDPEIGRFPTIDPLADKYPSSSPFVYTLNNPVRFFDSDGRDVIDAKTGKSLSVKEVTKRTLNVVKQILDEKNLTQKGRYKFYGVFQFDVATTSTNFREELYQPWGGAEVQFGGDFEGGTGVNKGYPRFIINTQFTLTEEQQARGYFTVGSFAEIQPAPALGEDVFRVKFSAGRHDPSGNPDSAGRGNTQRGTVVIIIGTIDEINEELNKIGYEAYKSYGGYDIRLLQQEEEEN